MPTCASWRGCMLAATPPPSAAIIESRSVKTLPGGVHGSDGSKKLVGRKRHILVDSQGFFLADVVRSASIPDRTGGQRILEAAGATFPRLQHIWADQGYTGTLVCWAAQEYGWTLQVVYPTDRQLKRYAPEMLADWGYEPGFRVIPKRWFAERTFSKSVFGSGEHGSLSGTPGMPYRSFSAE